MIECSRLLRSTGRLRKTAPVSGLLIGHTLVSRSAHRVHEFTDPVGRLMFNVLAVVADFR